jgi:hypothetical protein
VSPDLNLPRRKPGPANRRGDRCDSCGKRAPDVVGPILLGIHKWGEFGIDGEHEGRAWRASVLLCPDHAERMAAFVGSGGIAGQGPTPPRIVSNEGGFYEDPEWIADAA